MAQLTLEDFPAMVLREFPQLSEEFEENTGLPHVQMGALARLLQTAKGAGGWAEYGRAASLADRLWGNADAGLRNALNVSLLELIDFDGPRCAKAWSLLSVRLQRAWRAMAVYNAWLHSG